MPKKVKASKVFVCQQTQTDEVLIDALTRKMELLSLNGTISTVMLKAKQIKESVEFQTSLLSKDEFSIDELKGIDSLKV